MADKTLSILIKTIFDGKGAKDAKEQLKGISSFSDSKDLFNQTTRNVKANEKFVNSLNSVNIALRKKKGGKGDEFVNKNTGKAFKDVESAALEYLKREKQISREIAHGKDLEKQRISLTKRRLALNKKMGVRRELDENQNFLKATQNIMPKAKSKGFMEIDKFMERLPDKTKKATAGLFHFSRAMGALSLLFAGQSIIRNVTRLSSVTTAKFLEITKSQTAAGQAMTALSANFQFLQFTIGNAIATALQPLIPTLVSIISLVSEFVGNHPKLVSFGIGLMFITGVAMLAFAQFILLSAGINALIGPTVMAKMGGFMGLLKKLPGLAKTAGASIWSALLGPLGLLLLLGVAAVTSSDTTRKAMGTAFKGIGEALGLLVVDIAGLFGWTVELGDAWKLIGVLGAWAFNFIAYAIVVVLNVIRSVIQAVKWLYFGVGAAFDKIGLATAKATKKLYEWKDALPFGDEEQNIKDISAQIDKMTTSLANNQAKAEEAGTAFKEIWKGTDTTGKIVDNLNIKELWKNAMAEGGVEDVAPLQTEVTENIVKGEQEQRAETVKTNDEIERKISLLKELNELTKGKTPSVDTAFDLLDEIALSGTKTDATTIN